MSLEQQILLKVPTFFLGVIIVGGSIVLSIAGLLLVHHLIPRHKLKLHHDVADPILGAMSVVYAVLLAFVVIIVWQNFDKSDSAVRLEANYLADIYRDAEAFSPDFRGKIGNLLREYREAVVKYEWPAMQKGEMSQEVEGLMNKIWSLYTTYQPKNKTEEAFFNESVRKLNEFRELRRQRIMESRVGIHPLLWSVLLLGAFAVMCFTFLFGAENVKVQLLMIILLSATIALILLAILLMDYPFTGDVTISAEPFKQIILN